MLFSVYAILPFISRGIIFLVDVNSFWRSVRLFHDVEILDRESRIVTRSNGVETSWLAAGWPVDTKRYVTQVPNDISGRREDDLSLVPSLPQSLFRDPPCFSPTFFRGNHASHRSQELFSSSAVERKFHLFIINKSLSI